MLNGEGLRVVLWVSGCNHFCNGCHNQSTWDINSGLVFDEKVEEELFEYLSKDYISGLTLSGGDPLHQNNIEEIKRIVVKFKKIYPFKTIWLYTGHIWDDMKDYDFISLIDVVVDGRYEKELFDRSLKWMGSSNQRIINVKKSLEMNYVVELNK